MQSANQQLETAIRKGEVDDVTKALNKCAEVNAPHYSGYPPLIFATLYTYNQHDEHENQDKREKVISCLIYKGADINQTGQFGCTALHWAVKSESVKCIEFLLEQSADVNAQDHTGRAPLMHALSAGRVDIVHLLLTDRANVYLENKDGKTALGLALIPVNKKDYNMNNKDGREKYEGLCIDRTKIATLIFDHTKKYEGIDKATEAFDKEMINNNPDMNKDIANYFSKRTKITTANVEPLKPKKGIIMINEI